MGKHKEHSVLSKEIADAKTRIAIGANYRHHKDPNKLYKVLDLGFLEVNDEIHVIYQAQYGDELIFLRSLTSWLEKVEWKGETLSRFIKT